MKINYAITISFLLIIFAIYYSFTSLLPSKISNLNTPKTEFSTERALVQLKEITKKPHYVGTEEHTKVRNYIVAELENIGLKVEIQEQMALNKKWRGAVKAKNIIARIKGSQPGKSLVLLTHYDSAVHSSYGASDAGSGVVAILEGVRAFLETGKKPKNDIIILITDAEEIGLLGAVAFVNHHPWAKNVGLILNLEARGSGGPSYMLLETNGGNKELINAFNKAKANYPVANSLMYSIYKMLPNDTDLTPLREEGNLNGINFAFIDDHFDYHTAQDTYENLDRNTLEQQGDYLMTMLNYFSDANLESLNSKKDNVYFNFPFLGLVTYPFSWIIAMFILGALLFLGITYYGVQKQKLTTPAMFAGFVPFLGSIIVSVLVAVFGWKLIKIIHPQYNDILHGFTYNGYLYIIAFVSITLAITFYFYKRYFIKHSAANLIVAPIFIWGIINLLIVIYLKGAAFFILPVYAALATLAMLLYSKRNKKQKFYKSILWLQNGTICRKFTAYEFG
ncbi:MAG TPA: M20/M25/M40 family metallo-hydrolase [Flavobacteriaceae bacterium]|nr:M20/M25/M40 family metallo-hydrolase [Flavobacteriaceae bacterium]